MKAILMSIQPKWCVKIISGEKTIEVRKTAPKEVPFKVYIYCTKDKRGKIGKPSINYKTVGIWKKTFCPPSFVGFGGKVIGEFICDEVIYLTYETKLPTVKQNEDGTLSIIGYTTTEPFYNGKISTIKGSCLEQNPLSVIK